MSDDKADDLTDDQVKIDIWGICVNRDIFRVQDEFRGSEGRIKVNKYYKACSFVSQFTKRNGPELTLEDLQKVRSEASSFSTGIARKSALADYNKTLTKDLSRSGSEWLLIDGRADIYGVSKLTYADGSFDYVSNKTAHRYGISEILWEMGIDHTLEDIGTGYSEAEYKECFDRLVRFVKDRYGDRIILNCSLDAGFFLDFDGTIQESSSDMMAINNAFLMRFNLDFIRATGCYYIKCPMFQMADVYHRWGLYTLHYIEEHYAYLERCIETIVFGGEGVERRLEDLYFEYSVLFSQIRAGEILSIRNGIERFLGFKRDGDRDEALGILERMMSQKLPQAEVEMAKLYAEGMFVEKDFLRAESMIQKVINGGMRGAYKDLFDIYWEEKDPEFYPKMIEVVKEGSDKGHKWALERLSKAYRYGIGIEKDLGEAARLMKPVAEAFRGEDIRDTYFDLLLELDDPELYGDMIDSIYRLAMSGSPESKARYGLA
ncbi:MAG: sel1 repeat family protein [Candidatus Methanomethylophilaceae archaeon]|nr:sel1 repeat family protein [Candidatus Methanomethylophilaceae archaeon]